MNGHLRAKRRILAAIAATAFVAGCGGTDAIGVDATTAVSTAQADDDTASNREETIAIAYRVTGPTGSVVDVDQVLETTAGTQEQSLQHTLDSSAEGTAFTPFIRGVDFTITVSEGGPVTFEAFRTRLDPEAPPFADFDEIDVTESLDTVEVEADAPRTISVP